MKTIQYQLDQGVATVTFDAPNEAVNTLSQAWQQDLSRLVEQVLRDLPRGIILRSAKSTFFAGADLKETMRLQACDAAAIFRAVEQIKKNFRTLETLGIPLVSCLSGSALGGGWELALLGHQRIAVDARNIQFGLPEVTLGLLPGLCGTTKMTRLLGALAAQPFLLEGRLFSPQEALKLGLVQQLVATPDTLHAQALAWIDAHAQAQHPWEVKGYQVPGGLPSSPALASLLALAPAALKLKTRGLYRAPEAILACMIEGLQVDIATALRIETRYLTQLLTGAQAKAMINTFFFDLNAIKSGQARPTQAPHWLPTRVGVLGAGMMGGAIAYAQASHGIRTVLKDVSQAKADQGKAYSQRLTQERVSKGRMTATEQQLLLARIHSTGELQDLQDCDMMIEAVFEDRAVKAQVTQEAEPLLAASGIFASNTSTLPISSLALASRAPGNFIGMHFFSPADKMQLVEIIRGQHTADATVARALDYVQAIGKLAIVVNDSRGFYTSRVFGTYVLQGLAMLLEGIAAPAIENAALQCGMPTGPLALLDETSFTLILHVMAQTRADGAAEGQAYEVSASELLLSNMVNQYQRAGRAAGAGFYEYPTEPGQKKFLWPRLKTLYEKPNAVWNISEMKDRLLYRQALEAARCLSENVLTSVAEANIGSIFGIGFPAWTGGALAFIYGMGIDTFVERANALATRFGDGFAVSPEVTKTLRHYQPVY